MESVLTTNLEGSIEIELTQRNGEANAVVIRSSRPRLARKLMTGCTPEAAAERAGLIFSLCGKAQRVAAEAACEAAQNRVSDAEAHAARERRVLIELAQEHAWHLLLHWPQLVGRPAGMDTVKATDKSTDMANDLASLLALRKAADVPLAFPDQLDALLHKVLLGEPAVDWLTRDLSAFDAWRQRAATLPAALFAAWSGAADHGISRSRLLPPLRQWDAAQCAELAGRAFQDEAFCGQPEWTGAPAETGAIARMQTHPLLAAWIALRGRGAGARQLARLLELAELPRRLRVGGNAVVKAQSLGDNTGMSAIETSRGVLIHAVRLMGGKVADYRIVAPTEWNFHPTGSLAQALADLPPGDDALARAESICQSLDPCVSFGIEIGHA